MFRKKLASNIGWFTLLIIDLKVECLHGFIAQQARE